MFSPVPESGRLQRRTLLWWMSAFLVIAMVVALSILLEFAL